MKNTIKITSIILTVLCLAVCCLLLPAVSADAYALVYEVDTSVSDRDASGEYDAQSAVSLTPDDDLAITQAGVYILSGTYENKMIVVDAAKEDKVQIVLQNAVLNNANGPAIYVRSADKVFITAAAGTENSISDGSGYSLTEDDTTLDAAIFSKEDLTINGSGKLTISGNNKHAAVSKDDLVVTAKNLTITARNTGLSGKDSVNISDAGISVLAGSNGIYSDDYVVVSRGTIDITASEGIEAAYILISGGTISIQASDDGINAPWKSSTYTPAVEITGGTITVTMGAGDTDAIDSNGSLIISGGTINIYANSPFDYDGSASFTGGTVYVNGTQVTTLQNQMMGGRGGWGMQGGFWGNSNGQGSYSEGQGQQGGYSNGWGAQGGFGNQGGFGGHGPRH